METPGAAPAKQHLCVICNCLLALSLGPPVHGQVHGQTQSQTQSQVHAQAVVIVANPGIKAVEVSSADLRDVFTGASSTLRDGSRVTPVLLKAGPVNDSFLTLYIGRSDSAFRANWRSLLFSGQGVLPRTLDSDAAMVEYVARTPGAIGYIAKSTPHEGAKTLAVR